MGGRVTVESVADLVWNTQKSPMSSYKELALSFHLLEKPAGLFISIASFLRERVLQSSPRFV